jgi:hypothetical protein
MWFKDVEINPDDPFGLNEELPNQFEHSNFISHQLASSRTLSNELPSANLSNPLKNSFIDSLNISEVECKESSGFNKHSNDIFQ